MKVMVLLERIELSASPLPRVRSTTELQQHTVEARAIVARGGNVKQGLKLMSLSAKAFHMSEGAGKNMSREERLAAKLRENLRRRKAQGRDIKTESQDKELPKDNSES